MARAFSASTATLAAATATNLAALLAAEGYTGSMVGSHLQIAAQSLTDLFIGSSASVDATIGRPITAALGPFTRSAPPMVDPSRFWLFSTGGGEVGITFEPM